MLGAMRREGALRSMLTVAAAALLLAACTPGETPSPSPSPATTEVAPSQSPTSSPPSADPGDLPGFGEGPVPSERPQRTTTLGGELEVTVGETVQRFDDVTCVDGGGLLVTASAGGLTSVQFTTDAEGRLVNAAIAMPDQVTGVVGDSVGSATFAGSPSSFTVRGSMASATDGATELVPFSLTGHCTG